jgi:hypothetical protein
MRLIPLRPARAAVLSFFAALACLEVGNGVVVGEAWRLNHDKVFVSIDERWELHLLLERLRVLEGVVAAGAAATTVLWACIAITNVAIASRRRRTMVFGLTAWVAGPVLVGVLGRVSTVGRPAHFDIFVLLAQVTVLYWPFWVLSSASARVGGLRLPAARWYIGLVLALVVHRLFTGSLDLSTPSPADDLGRTAVLFLVNAIVVGVIVVMAAEATNDMQLAIVERYALHQHWREDAQARFGSRHSTGEHPVVLAAPVAVTPES